MAIRFSFPFCFFVLCVVLLSVHLISAADQPTGHRHKRAAPDTDVGASASKGDDKATTLPSTDVKDPSNNLNEEGGAIDLDDVTKIITALVTALTTFVENVAEDVTKLVTDIKENVLPTLLGLVNSLTGLVGNGLLGGGSDE